MDFLELLQTVALCIGSLALVVIAMSMITISSIFGGIPSIRPIPYSEDYDEDYDDEDYDDEDYDDEDYDDTDYRDYGNNIPNRLDATGIEPKKPRKGIDGGKKR